MKRDNMNTEVELKCPLYCGMKAIEQINKIKEILAEKNGIADSQEFGLSYCQAINYLEDIEQVLKGENNG